MTPLVSSACKLCMVAWLLTFGMACGDRYHLSRAEAIKHFYKNKGEFDRIASDWITGHPNDSIFVRLWAGDIRWNSTTISLVPRDGLVTVSHDTVRQDMSFESAARSAGGDPLVLRTWVDRLRRLRVSHISVIGTRLPESDRYVVIDLQEPGAHYGYIFVPSDHRAPFAADNCSDCSGFDLLRTLGGGWFYYESA
jgi:hypothetical protein